MASDQERQARVRVPPLEAGGSQKGPFWADWPLAWRLPLMTALFVFLLAFFLTQIGLGQAEQREAEVRQDLASAFLDTLAGVVAPTLSATRSREDVAALFASAATFKPTLRNEAVGLCCLADGGPLVSFSARPSQGGHVTSDALRAFLLEADRSDGNGPQMLVDEDRGKFLLAQIYPTGIGAVALGAAFDLNVMREDQAQTRRVALAIDISLAFVAAFLSFIVTRRSLRPIEALTRHLAERSEPASLPRNLAGENTEAGRLQRAIAARMEEEAETAALAASEGERAREAVLARLAAGLAHEVRNPVAGMSAAVSTLRRYGDDPAVREQTLDLIDRGLSSIDHVAASMLSTYRPPETKRYVTPADLDDLQVLIRPKVRRKGIDLTFDNALTDTFPAHADAIRQIVLNLLLNAAEAAPQEGKVGFSAARVGDALALTVSDNGPGLPDEALSVITDRDNLTRPQSRRLGLWLVHKLIDDVKGRLSIESRAEQGTSITITVPPIKQDASSDG